MHKHSNFLRSYSAGNDDNKFFITRLRFADRDQWECYIILFEVGSHYLQWNPFSEHQWELSICPA